MEDYFSKGLLEVKNMPVNAGDARDMSLIPGLGRSPRKELATHSSILAWKIPWTEEPDRLQFMKLQSWIWLSTHTYTHTQSPSDNSLLGKERSSCIEDCLTLCRRKGHGDVNVQHLAVSMMDVTGKKNKQTAKPD